MAIDEYGQIIRRTNRQKNNDETSQGNLETKSDKIANLRGIKTDNSATPKENTSEEMNNKKVNSINPAILQKKIKEQIKDIE